MNKRSLLRIKEIFNDGSISIENDKPTTMVIDGTNTFIRAFAANPTMDQNGDHIGGVLGFLLSIGAGLKRINPSKCIIVFDGKKGSVRRRQIYPEYKHGRKIVKNYNRIEYLKEDIKNNDDYQMSLLLKILEQLPVYIVIIDGVEADDVISSIVKKYKDENINLTIMSNDRDFFQLINENVNIYYPAKHTIYNINTFKEEFSFDSNNFIYHKIVQGDDSDNIPGVKSIGPKSIEKFLKNIYDGDIEDIDDFLNRIEKYKDENNKTKLLNENKEIIIRNYKLMNLHDGGFLDARDNIQLSHILNDDSYISYNIFEFSKLVTYHRILTKYNPLVWYQRIFKSVKTK